MPKVWSERIDSILADSKKARLAAALYYLVDQSVKSPVTRKRTTPEELLMEEAYSILNFIEKEEKEVATNG